jgi:hypothetical protein
MVVGVELVEAVVVLMVIKEVAVVAVEEVMQGVVVEVMVVLWPMLLPWRAVLKLTLLPQRMFHLLP